MSGPVEQPGPPELAAAGDAHERPLWASVRWAAIVSVIGALTCAFVLECSGLVGADPTWWKRTFLSINFLADSTVIWLLLVVMIGLFNRVMLPVGLLFATSFVVGVANWVKLGIRSEPVYPSDVDFIREPKFLTTMVSPTFLVIALMIAIGIVLVAVLVARKFERTMVGIWPEHLPFRGQLLAVGVRAVVVTFAVVMLANAAGFNSPGNLWRKVYNTSGYNWYPANQRDNYQAHGFVGGFLYNMPTTAMLTPEGYSEQSMAAITARYEKVAKRINKHRSGSLAKTNVIVVLSESFSDPTRLKGFTLDQDPIPKTRKLLGRTTSGTMMTQLYGGGTANMEFESLTGQSLGLFTPQMTSPYQMLVSSYSQYPSAVGWFAAHGHEPVAIHPYLPGIYQRDKVYKTFGFDKFIHDTSMTEKNKIDKSRYISDQSAFDEAERQIAESKKPLMINLVTMQNHIPTDNSYTDPIPATGLSGSEENRVSNYARGISHTDDALASFLAKLKKSKEKTVVVFYGDHLPGIYSEGTREKNTDLKIHETPFFIWSNRGTPEHEALPVTSPIHFLPLLYQLADAKIPPYFAMLQELRGQVSAIEQGRILTPSGEQLERTQLPLKGQKLLDDAQMVQYDFSIGKRYAVDKMWPGALRTEDPPAAE